MRKISSTASWLVLCLFALPICLSANKYPPVVYEYQEKLDTCEGLDRVKTLSNLAKIMNSYDTLSAQKYMKELIP